MRVDDFFSIGDTLFQQSTSDPMIEEICLRTAINRLYYGLFHFLQKRLGIVIPFDQKSRCHKYVKEAIEQFSLLNDYSQIEELRIRSDYELSSSLKSADYVNAERLKRRIISEVDGTEETSSDDDAEYFDRESR